MRYPFRAGREQRDAAGDSRPTAGDRRRPGHLGERALAEGDESAAADAFEAAERLTVTLRAPDQAGRAHEGLAAVAAHRGDQEAGRRYLTCAAEACAADGADRRRLVDSLRDLAVGSTDVW